VKIIRYDCFTTKITKGTKNFNKNKDFVFLRDLRGE